MREVRMTFGEHLEELRRRLFMSILWLSIAVGVCLIYGERLLKWTLGPHETAIRGAVRDRSIGILEVKSSGLTDLIAGKGDLTPGVPAKAEGGAPLAWEELFAGELRRGRLERELQAFARAEVVPLLDNKLEAAEIDRLAAGIAKAIDAALSEGGLALQARSLPERFKLLEENLQRVRARLSNMPLKRLLGVGRDLGVALEHLGTFNRFLAARRQELMEAPAPAARPAGSEASELMRHLEVVYRDMEARANQLAEDQAKPPIAISYLESFMTYFKVAMVFGLFFSIPLILYEMWKFIGAGLYPHEQKYALMFLPFSVGLFFGGAMFGYFSVIPVSLEFLAGWGADLVEPNITISHYVGLFFTLTVLLGLVFQTPLVMIFLSKIGAVGSAGFRKVRKWAMLSAVVFAAVVTPPDPLSWSLVAGPMILLYELGIWIVVAAERKGAARVPQKREGVPA